MSLYGRNIIDRIKSTISHRLTLPVPPYHSPAYWDEVRSTSILNERNKSVIL